MTEDRAKAPEAPSASRFAAIHPFGALVVAGVASWSAPGLTAIVCGLIAVASLGMTIVVMRKPGVVQSPNVLGLLMAVPLASLTGSALVGVTCGALWTVSSDWKRRTSLRGHWGQSMDPRWALALGMAAGVAAEDALLQWSPALSSTSRLEMALIAMVVVGLLAAMTIVPPVRG